MKVRTIDIGLCSIALLAVAGIAQAARLSNTDEQFMLMAAKADMSEAHEAQMAEIQANRADVKAFAKTLDQDHRKSYEELTELAAHVGITIPKGIDAAKDPTVEHLLILKGNQFDHQFVKDEIASRRHAIVVFKRETERGRDAGLKAYATSMIPVLEKELHLVEECSKPAKRS